MARKLKEGANVAWLGSDNPNAPDGAGFYEVLKDNEHELDDNGHPVFTNVQVKLGKKLNWVKNTPDEEGKPPNPENNEGHWVYASDHGEGGVDE